MEDAKGFDASRVLADLRTLDELTGGPAGARRVAWTPVWQQARTWLAGELERCGLRPERDQAGNLWTTLAGDRPEILAVGSHLDSVPDGGWLDGALGVLTGLEILRHHAATGAPPGRTLALIDWADEEGARFGHSLLGSSAVAGTLDVDEAGSLTDAAGLTLREAMAANGVDIAAAPQAAERIAGLCAYLELHIEQGPVLASERVPVAAVDGTVGIDRQRLTFVGTAAHSGPTPMSHRHDAGLAAAELAPEIERLAIERDGRGTAGELHLSPNVPTVVPGLAEIVIDLRHAQPGPLAELAAASWQAAQRIAARRGCQVSRRPVWRIDPIAFDDGLVERAADACERTSGQRLRLTSGALHDAASLAPRVPTAMIFCASIGGISHAPQENSSDADLLSAINAFALLVEDVLSADVTP